jgi:4-hydroxybenzoate polyprenyltransferase
MSAPIRPEFEPVSERESPRRGRNAILPWLRLMRLPNVFTAIADVAVGYLFVQHERIDGLVLGCLIVASACLYTAGIVFNDVFDRQIDAKERPFRPIPSGQISLPSAGALAGILLIIGVLLGWIADVLARAPSEFPWRSGFVATILALAILAYDGALKNTHFGPLMMGACRTLNVMLGMSGGEWAPPPRTFLGFGVGAMHVVLGIGFYIVGVTMFSRGEAEKSRRLVLIAGIFAMVFGVVLLGMSALHQTLQFQSQAYGRQLYWLLLTLLMLSVMRRCVVAVIDPTSQKVQAAVKLAILSLIWLDAATALAVAGPVYGVAIAALMIPALVLGRWVYST